MLKLQDINVGEMNKVGVPIFFHSLTKTGSRLKSSPL